jgi:hypothetical protein
MAAWTIMVHAAEVVLRERIGWRKKDPANPTTTTIVMENASR